MLNQIPGKSLPIFWNNACNKLNKRYFLNQIYFILLFFVISVFPIFPAFNLTFFFNYKEHFCYDELSDNSIVNYYNHWGTGSRIMMILLYTPLKPSSRHTDLSSPPCGSVLCFREGANSWMLLPAWSFIITDRAKVWQLLAYPALIPSAQTHSRGDCQLHESWNFTAERQAGIWQPAPGGLG